MNLGLAQPALKTHEFSACVNGVSQLNLSKFNQVKHFKSLKSFAKEISIYITNHLPLSTLTYLFYQHVRHCFSISNIIYLIFAIIIYKYFCTKVLHCDLNLLN